MDSGRITSGSFATRPSPGACSATPSPASIAPGGGKSVAAAIHRTQQWLLRQQHADGHWVAELEGDTILESEYILLLAWLGRHHSELARKAANYIVAQQLPSGGWSLYPGGQVEISASVKAYFALKLTGHDPATDYMRRARAAILAGGGADAVNSFTRFYLALLGQISYDHCPAVPPEMLLLPKWLPINLYGVSAWSRTILVPLSILSACRPATALDRSLGIGELFIRPPERWPPLRCPGLDRSEGLLSWDTFFRTTDRLLKACQRYRLLPLRRRAIRAAEQWMVERFQGSDGLGAIFPPMVWAIIALRCLGYDDDSPELGYCHERLSGLIIEEGDSVRLQPCKSPVWDTAITLRALFDSGLPAEHDAVRQGVGWLLDQQILQPGDWRETVDAEPGGWCFEYANDFYPDLDDTAMVTMALAAQFAPSASPELDCGQASTGQPRMTAARPPAAPGDQDDALLARTTTAIARAERWMMAMQNRDGGWGAFDRDNDRQYLCYVPFADHNAMIDPSSPDLAARVIEALGHLGRRIGDPLVDRAVDYLRRTQEPDGAWFGRWGVNYIYGTWQVLSGLAAVGVAPQDPLVVGGADWLIACQQPDGAWGESPDSYADAELRGQGPPTPSQTAWAILGLLAAGCRDHPAVSRGADWLLKGQRSDGTWDETEFTGTGFPRVFYLRYHYYRIYFPLMALARYAAAAGTPAALSTVAPMAAAQGRDGSGNC